MSDDLWQLLTGAIIVAIVFLLVRPGSPVNSAITQTSDALQAMIQTATGYTATQ